MPFSVYLLEGRVGWYLLEISFLVSFVFSVSLAFCHKTTRKAWVYWLTCASLLLVVGGFSFGAEYLIRKIIDSLQESATHTWWLLQPFVYSIYQILYYAVCVFGTLILFRVGLKIPSGLLLTYSLIALSADIILKAIANIILLLATIPEFPYELLASFLLLLNGLFGFILFLGFRNRTVFSPLYRPALCLFIVAFVAYFVLIIFDQFDYAYSLFYNIGLLLFALPFGGLAYIYVDRSQKLKDYADLQLDYDLEKANEAAKENARKDVQLALHDLRHFIRSFDGKLPPEQIESMEKALDNYDLKIKTSRETLNYVLGSKNEYAASHQINFTFSGDSNDLAFLTDEDLYSLFENILSNAFEAVSKLPEVSKRVVSVNLKKQGKMVILSELNYYEGNLVYQDRQLETTKEDKTIHGFGMKSIQAVMDAYEGTLTTSAKDGIFELTVVFPGQLTGN